MKTAMQELIQWYQNEHFVKTPFNIQLLNKLESLLEKEKEQIMEAWYNGFDELRPFVDHSEEYYNKTYNQNK